MSHVLSGLALIVSGATTMVVSLRYLIRGRR